jgi:hypothetical protein
VPSNISEDFDDQLGGEFRVGVIEFGWERRSYRSSLVDEGWACGFAKMAEGFAEHVIVQRPVITGVTGRLASEDVLERACLRVSLRERFPMSGYEIVVYGKGRQMFAAYTEMQVIEILRCLRGIADDLSAPGARLDSTLLDFWGEAANDLAMAQVGNAITSFWTFPPTPL